MVCSDCKGMDANRLHRHILSYLDKSQSSSLLSDSASLLASVICGLQGNLIAIIIRVIVNRLDGRVLSSLLKQLVVDAWRDSTSGWI